MTEEVIAGSFWLRGRGRGGTGCDWDNTFIDPHKLDEAKVLI